VGLTHLSVPVGSDGNYVGLLTFELPAGSPSGARYQTVVRQLSDHGTLGQAVGTAALARVRPSLRRVIGAFQISVPIVPAAELLGRREPKTAAAVRDEVAGSHRVIIFGFSLGSSGWPETPAGRRKRGPRLGRTR